MFVKSIFIKTKIKESNNKLVLLFLNLIYSSTIMNTDNLKILKCNWSKSKASEIIKKEKKNELIYWKNS